MRSPIAMQLLKANASAAVPQDGRALQPPHSCLFHFSRRLCTTQQVDERRAPLFLIGLLGDGFQYKAVRG